MIFLQEWNNPNKKLDKIIKKTNFWEYIKKQLKLRSKTMKVGYQIISHIACIGCEDSFKFG